MEPIRIQTLFNSINQSNPMFVADLREEALYEHCRLRGASKLSIDDCANEEIFLHAMTKIAKMNNISILLVVDNTVSREKFHGVIADIKACAEAAKEGNENEAKTNDAENQCLRSRWKKVTSVDYVDFDHFFQAFPHCASLYLGSHFPNQQLNKRPPKLYPTAIIPGFMYLGNYYDASDEVIVTDLRVTHIVDATSSYLSQDNATKLNIAYLPVQVWDMEGVDIFQHFETVLAFILAAKGADGKILIHCRAGISRSATFVLAYLMYSGTCRSLKAALELVVPARPYVLPNKSFRAQLMDYEETLFGTRSLVDDSAFLALVSSMNFCWSGIFSMETDHDKIPIIAASQRINTAVYKDEFPPEGTEAQAKAAKPKKPFLRRGEGKNTANLKAAAAAQAATATTTTTSTAAAEVVAVTAAEGEGEDPVIQDA